MKVKITAHNGPTVRGVCWTPPTNQSILLQKIVISIASASGAAAVVLRTSEDNQLMPSIVLANNATLIIDGLNIELQPDEVITVDYAGSDGVASVGLYGEEI